MKQELKEKTNKKESINLFNMLKENNTNSSIESKYGCEIQPFRTRRLADEQKSKIRSFAVKPYMMLKPTSLISKLKNVIEWRYMGDSNFRKKIVKDILRRLEEKDISDDRNSYKQIKSSERWLDNKYQELNYKMGTSSFYNEEVAKEFDITDIMMECVKHYEPNENISDKTDKTFEEVLLMENIPEELANALAYQKIIILDDRCENLFNAVITIKNIIYDYYKKDKKVPLPFEHREEIENLKSIIRKTKQEQILINCK